MDVGGFREPSKVGPTAGLTVAFFIRNGAPEAEEGFERILTTELVRSNLES